MWREQVFSEIDRDLVRATGSQARGRGSWQNRGRMGFRCGG